MKLNRIFECNKKYKIHLSNSLYWSGSELIVNSRYFIWFHLHDWNFYCSDHYFWKEIDNEEYQ